MPIKCTITITDEFDEYNEKRLRVTAAPDPMKVSQNTNGVRWKIVNNSGASAIVKLRQFTNQTTAANPDDPCTDVTPRRKVTVPGGATDFIEVDVQGIVGDRHKYSINIGKVVAVDPELEVQP